MTVGRRLRFEILKRDGYTCRYCGAAAPDVVLHVDHVVPVALGGGDEPSNLVTACADCNAGKASSSPDDQIVADVDAASLLFAKASAEAALRRREELSEMDAYLAEFDDVWDGYRTVATDSPIPRPNDWAESIEGFLSQGLDMDDLERFVGVAMNKVRAGDVFRYFCGCCWREISRRQELARRLVEDGEV